MRCRQFMATHGMKEESLNTFATSDSNSAAPATYSAGTSAQYVEKAQQNAAAQAVQQPQARTATAQASAAGNATFRGGNVQQSSAATSSARPSTASAGSNSMQSSAAGSQSVQGTAAQPAAKSYGSNTISVNLLGLGKITQSSGSSNIFGTAQKQPQSAASAASRPQPQVTATAAAPATPQAAQGFNQPAGPSAVAVTAVKPNITQAQTAPAAPAATMPGAATQHAARTQAVPAEGMTSGTVAAGASAQADSQSQIPQKPVYKPGMSRSEYMDQVLKYVRSLNEESSKKARQQAAAQPQPAQQQQPELQNYGECPDMPANYTPMPDPRKYGIGTRPVTELDIRLAFKALKADPARCGCSIELMSKQMFFYHQHKTNWHMYCDKRRVEINLQNIQQACLFWLKGAEKRFAEKQQAARAAGMPQPQDR